MSHEAPKAVVPMSWRADPPEWAAYVSSVVAIDRGTEVHLAIDMRSKSLGGKSEKTKMLRSLTPKGFALAFCAANAGGQLGRKIKAIEAAANEIVEAPPAGLAPSYISGFLNRNLPDIRLRAWERTG